jgi:hypothetical protein
MSIPLEFAEIETVLAPEVAGAATGVEDAGAAVLVVGAAAAVELLDVLLELLPQPANTIATTAVAARNTFVISIPPARGLNRLLSYDDTSR